MAIVEVRPLPVKRWHGKKGTESFTQPKTVEVLYDPKLGAYATGLTEEEASIYGKKIGADLSDTYSLDNPHPFWSTKASWIRLENHTQIFDTDKPRDFVRVANMKASKYVANSMEDYDKGLYPEATHVIFDEASEVAQKATKIERHNQAMQLVMKMSTEDKQNIVRIIAKKSVKNQSADFLTVEMDDIITNRTEEFLKEMQKGKPQISIMGFVYDLEDKNIITRDASGYYYMGDLLGLDFNETVAFFSNPVNAKLKVMLLEKLNNK